MASTDVQSALLEAWAAIGSGGTGAVVNVVTKDTPNEGSLVTYQVTQGGNKVGVDIDVPKDPDMEKMILPQEPEWDATNNTLYANGVAIRIVDDGTQNVAHFRTSHVEDHTLPFPYFATVYGGARGDSEFTHHFESSNIVIDGAKLHSVFGGCQDFGDIGTANIVMFGGTIRNSLMGGPNSFATGANAAVGEANIKVYDGTLYML